MMKKENEEKAESKVVEKVAAAVAKVKANEAAVVAKKEVIPKDILVRLAGKSEEEIASSEEDYDFSSLNQIHLVEAKKWFREVRPFVSRNYGGKVLSSYACWVKRNVEFSRTYKGHLIRSLSYETGPLWHTHRAGEGEESEEGRDKGEKSEGEEVVVA